MLFSNFSQDIIRSYLDFCESSSYLFRRTIFTIISNNIIKVGYIIMFMIL